MLMANLNHRVFEEESRSFPDISSNEALHETVQIVLPVFLGYAYAGDGYCAGCQMAGICVDEGFSKLMNGYWENGLVLRLYIQCSSG
jgi:hypothetical protein